METKLISFSVGEGVDETEPMDVDEGNRMVESAFVRCES